MHNMYSVHRNNEKRWFLIANFQLSVTTELSVRPNDHIVTNDDDANDIINNYIQCTNICLKNKSN